jgi:hypothetical protein
MCSGRRRWKSSEIAWPSASDRCSGSSPNWKVSRAWRPGQHPVELGEDLWQSFLWNVDDRAATAS